MARFARYCCAAWPVAALLLAAPVASLGLSAEARAAQAGESLTTAATRPTSEPPGKVDARRPPIAPLREGQIAQVELINREIRAGWKQAGVLPSARATDAEWCRRVYLDLIGRVPKVDELQRFLNDRPRVRHTNLVDRLLSKEYEKDFVRNWSTIWANLLIGRRGPLADGKQMVNRGGMNKYLTAAISENKPYDKFVYELITARGNNRPDEENFNGAVNYLSGKLDDHAIEATARTSQLFLGVQTRCTQCHDHPFNDWKQAQFWQMNAFFRQADLDRNGRKKRPDNVILGDKLDRPLVSQYDEADGAKVTAEAVFLDGTKPRSKRANGRVELAQLITRSPQMRQALVNRMWAHFFGYGFTKPIDDIGPHNEPTHPALLAELADEFGAAGHDMKQLMRWMVLSEPYALSSRTTPRNRSDEPSLGEKPAFSHFYTRRMRAEEIYQSLLVATEFDRTVKMTEKLDEFEKRWIEQINREFGADGDGDETASVGGTIPQALLMFNGDATRRATATGQGGMLDQVMQKQRTNPERIQYLYLATLARAPTTAELNMANTLLVSHKGEIRPTLEDIWWALLNSNQFILNY